MVTGDADEGSILVEVNTAEKTDSCRISPGTDSSAAAPIQGCSGMKRQHSGQGLQWLQQQP